MCQALKRHYTYLLLVFNITPLFLSLVDSEVRCRGGYELPPYCLCSSCITVSIAVSGTCSGWNSVGIAYGGEVPYASACLPPAFWLSSVYFVAGMRHRACMLRSGPRHFRGLEQFQITSYFRVLGCPRVGWYVVAPFEGYRYGVEEGGFVGYLQTQSHPFYLTVRCRRVYCVSTHPQGEYRTAHVVPSMSARQVRTCSVELARPLPVTVGMIVVSA